MQHNIERLGQLRQTPLYRCAHPPANAIALHRSAQNLANSKTHTRSRAAALTIKGNHVAGKMLLALPVNRLEVGMFQQP